MRLTKPPPVYQSLTRRKGTAPPVVPLPMFHVKHPFVRASRRCKMSLVEQGPHMWEHVFLDQGLPIPLHDDFEDDLVIAAAQRIDADFVVTFDRLLIHRAPRPASSRRT